MSGFKMLREFKSGYRGQVRLRQVKFSFQIMTYFVMLRLIMSV